MKHMIPIASCRDLDDDRADPDREFIAVASLALAAELRHEVDKVQQLGLGSPALSTRLILCQDLEEISRAYFKGKAG